MKEENIFEDWQGHLKWNKKKEDERKAQLKQ
jgi:hypothetical protein